MIAATILAGLLLQEPPTAKAPDAALFAELVRTTNALPAFVVEYKATKAGEDAAGTVQILYRAPGSAKIVLSDRAVFRIQDGVVDVRTFAAGEKPMVASVPLSKAHRDRYERIAPVVRAQFPDCADDWNAAFSDGIRFDLSVQEGANPSEKSLQFTASTAAAGSVLFGWLETLATRNASPQDGDRLVFEDPDGTRITLSTRTGFIEKVEKARPEGLSSFAVTRLDLSPQFDAAAFDLPAAPADATDGSASFAGQMQRIQTRTLRKRALSCVARLVAEKKVEWGPEAREKFAKVLEAVHGSAWTTENQAWAADMRKRMGEFSAWFGEKLRDPELADPRARTKLEEAVEQWRKSLAESARSGLDPRLADLSIDAGVIPDEAMRADVAALEREVVKKTMQTALVDPLLRELEEKVAEARRKP